jgi:hypothetical protein
MFHLTHFVAAIVLVLAGATVNAQDYRGDCCLEPYKRVSRDEPAELQKRTRLLYEGLLSTPYKELVLLKIDDDRVCKSIDCQGLSPIVVKKYVEAALGERQIEDNIKIQDAGAQAANRSSWIAGFSALIATCSLFATAIFGVLTLRHNRQSQRASIEARKG